jgi:hypothetical protein
MSTNTLPLSLKRRALLKKVLMGEPIGESALAVGYSSVKSGSNAIVSTRKRLLAAMDKLSLTPENFVRDYFLPLMNATSTITASYEGKITDTMEVVDNSTRLAAAKECAKLMQLYPKEEQVQSSLNITINNANTVNESE